MKEAGVLNIFVVEDDEWYRELLGYNLELNPDYHVTKFETAGDCLEKLHLRPDVITLDYRLPDMSGSEALRKIKVGAYDYIVKAKEIRDRLLNVIHNIRKNTSLKSRIDTLQQEVEQKYDFEKSIIGQSPAIKKVFVLIEKAIKTNITVTVTGETGTGKELVAKAVHYNSTRKSKPFVAVNVAAIPKDLVESELFGHEKGAFTGANIRRIGKFEEAHQGTLFLDEIGDMDLTMQAKLLRALQEKEVTPIGGNKVIKTDSRIVVATHRNLLEEVKAGRFREDLYYRLYGLCIELPPLRERGNDILVLARYFIERFCKENGLEQMTLSAAAQKKLMAYTYPGNIRELRSVVELAAVMGNGSEIDEDVISFSNYDALPNVLTEDLTLKTYTDRIIHLYLNKYDQNVKLVSDKLDISPSTIYRLIKETKEES